MLYCSIIDADRDAAANLERLVLLQFNTRLVANVSAVAEAAETLRDWRLDILFIRVSVWDEYLQLAGSLEFPPARVVFLSGRNDKCAQYLSDVVDFHLQPPYSAVAVRRIFERMCSPFFQPRSLRFFFLRVDCRFQVIPFDGLIWVQRVDHRSVRIRTNKEEYDVAGSLPQLERRLPGLFTRIRKDLLVAGGR